MILQIIFHTNFPSPVMVPLTVMAQGQAGFGTTALNQLVTLWIKTSVKTTAVLTRTLAILNRKIVNKEYNELWVMYVGILVAAHTSRLHAHIVLPSVDCLINSFMKVSQSVSPRKVTIHL